MRKPIRTKKAIAQDPDVQKAVAVNTPNSTMKENIIPKAIKKIHPDLSEAEAERLAALAAADSTASGSSSSGAVDKRFIRMAGQFIDLDDLHIDLIDQVNPFQKAFEVLSKSVNTKVLRIIQETIAATRLQMTEEEVLILYPTIKAFMQTEGREPNLQANDAIEKRMAEALLYLKDQKRKRQNG